MWSTARLLCRHRISDRSDHSTFRNPRKFGKRPARIQELTHHNPSRAICLTVHAIVALPERVFRCDFTAALIEIRENAGEHGILLTEALRKPTLIACHLRVYRLRRAREDPLRGAHGKTFEEHRLTDGCSETVVHLRELEMNRMGVG